MGAIADELSAELFDKKITDFSIDSRAVKAGEIFFALSQEDYARAGFNGSFADGHQYIKDAFDRGAIAAVWCAGPNSGGRALMGVADSLVLVSYANRAF